MHKFILTLFFLSLLLAAFGQQEEQFTQFMYYKSGYNPASVGSNDAPCFSLIARNQWIGFEGAPQAQLISFNMPVFNKRVGIGANVIRQTIGITEKYSAETLYAYRIPLGRGILGIGLQASVRFIRMNFSQAESIQPSAQDDAIPGDIQSKYVPNFGAGLYYSNQRYYVGISAPRLLENNIDLADSDATISKEVRHIYAMGGILIDLGDHVQMQPQVLLKYVMGAPFDGDANLNFIFAEKFTTGISYRLGGSKRTGIGESVSVVLGMQLSESILFGLSYDLTLSELKNYNSGTVEGVFRYCIGGRSQGNEYVSPRFF
ncbi:MAG: type IX secretion system membrane protein PorP/SprF [Saprospiraceae bacterium]|nr:type IX secretion system membrane protein PorP/SprF [Saprospiraceae bacterium]MCB9324600.1 type IX secretion system membrane protein PorP/SprF [Lewinellaceae bacterium]